jgi:hypothetical protein
LIGSFCLSAGIEAPGAVSSRLAGLTMPAAMVDAVVAGVSSGLILA